MAGGLLAPAPGEGPLLLDVGDFGLLHDVRLDLSSRHELAGARIFTTVRGGRVRLFGVVVSERQRTLALDVVRRVPGVRQVEDDLEVVPQAVDVREG